MIPAELLTQIGLKSSHLTSIQKFFEDRLRSDLALLRPVRINGRVKEPMSILQKLETGNYDSVTGLRDLVGITVVLLHRRDVQRAVDMLKATDIQVIPNEPVKTRPTSFQYREPKLYVMPPNEYIDRNPDAADIVVEVQFTSALQHALDMTTHDFDYKGKAYSWRNFRLVAQLGAMLETR